MENYNYKMFLSEKRDVTITKITPCCGNYAEFRTKQEKDNKLTMSIYCNKCKKAFLKWGAFEDKIHFSMKDEVKVKSILDL